MHRLLAGLACSAALLVGHAAGAGDAPIALGEVSPPPAASGLDVRALRHTAEGEIRQLDASQLRNRRRVVVSLALTQAALDPVVCTVNAAVRDARTGAMIAIIEASTSSVGPLSSELRKQLANAAVRSAIHRIPRALASND